MMKSHDWQILGHWKKETLKYVRMLYWDSYKKYTALRDQFLAFHYLDFLSPAPKKVILLKFYFAMYVSHLQ